MHAMRTWRRRLSSREEDRLALRHTPRLAAARRVELDHGRRAGLSVRGLEAHRILMRGA